MPSTQPPAAPSEHAERIPDYHSATLHDQIVSGGDGVRVLAGRYELVRFVGRGGMGEVWAGRDNVIGRRVAVKLLPHDRRDVPGAELFRREARTAGALNHPGVVTVHDFGQDESDGSLFLVMEFLDGRDLSTVLSEDGAPPVADAVEWTAQAAGALARAHEMDVVHRDLKPANLMLSPDGHIKILDFGIARFMETRPSSQVMGTFPYMPPERFDGHPGNARSDLYSLGCVLHELLTGQVPFQATSPASMMSAHLTKDPVPPGRVRTGVPAALDALVLELLAKKPEDRPGSAADVRARLRGLPSAQGSMSTTVPNIRTPVTRPVSRRKALWFGVAAITAGAGATAGIVLRDHGDDKESSALFSAKGAALSPPAVNNGIVYVCTQDAKDGTLCALDATSGSKKWSQHIPGGGHGQVKTEGVTNPVVIVPAPTVSNGVVYAELSGNLYAHDTATGARKWEYAVGGVSLLRTADGMTFAHVKHENALHAFDAATGAETWVARDTPADGVWTSGGLRGYAYVAGPDNVVVLNVTTGTKLGQAAVPAVWRLWPAGPLLIAGSHGVTMNLRGLDPVGGAEKWKVILGYDPDNSVEVADGTMYFVGRPSLDTGRCLQAVDTATGAVKWTGPPQTGLTQPGPVADRTVKAADGAVYMSGNSTTDVVNAGTGLPKWSVNTVDNDPAPEVADGTVFVLRTTTDPHVQAFGSATGRQKWTSTVTGSSLLFAEKAVYVTDLKTNSIYALDAATGKNL